MDDMNRGLASPLKFSVDRQTAFVYGRKVQTERYERMYTKINYDLIEKRTLTGKISAMENGFFKVVLLIIYGVFFAITFSLSYKADYFFARPSENMILEKIKKKLDKIAVFTREKATANKKEFSIELEQKIELLFNKEKINFSDQEEEKTFRGSVKINLEELQKELERLTEEQSRGLLSNLLCESLSRIAENIFENNIKKFEEYDAKQGKECVFQFRDHQGKIKVITAKAKREIFTIKHELLLNSLQWQEGESTEGLEEIFKSALEIEEDSNYEIIGQIEDLLMARKKNIQAKIAIAQGGELALSLKEIEEGLKTQSKTECSLTNEESRLVFIGVLYGLLAELYTIKLDKRTIGHDKFKLLSDLFLRDDQIGGEDSRQRQKKALSAVQNLTGLEVKQIFQEALSNGIKKLDEV